MKNSSFYALWLFSGFAMSLLGSGVHAQERSASGSVDLQMTWSALKNLVDAANMRTTVVDMKMQKVIGCGKKGMVYAPETAGADTDVCLKPAKDPDVTTLQGNVTNVQNTVNSFISCGNANQFYSQAQGRCVAPSNGPEVFTVYESHNTNGVGASAPFATVNCPANSVVLDCSPKAHYSLGPGPGSGSYSLGGNSGAEIRGNGCYNPLNAWISQFSARCLRNK